MKYYQIQFIEFCLSTGCLKFGEFTLKSGRISPYFFNSGLFNTGASVDRLGEFYAGTIIGNVGGDFMLFGPAYKGIPLATTTAAALARCYDRNVPFCFDRKEAKDHGEGGMIVGAPLAGNVVIIDDVITAGLSVRHSENLIRDAGACPAAVVISVDRQEKGLDDSRSAVQQVSEDLNLPVYAIVGLSDIVDYLGCRPEYADVTGRLEKYRDQYGV